MTNPSPSIQEEQQVDESPENVDDANALEAIYRSTNARNGKMYTAFGLVYGCGR